MKAFFEGIDLLSPVTLWPLFQNAFIVPSGPPRAVEADTVNASAVRVKWQAPEPELRHGQIRGFQVHYVRMNYGEPQGQPFVKDILVEESQVIVCSQNPSKNFVFVNRIFRTIRHNLRRNNDSDVFMNNYCSDLCTAIFGLKQLINFRFSLNTACLCHHLTTV